MNNAFELNKSAYFFWDNENYHASLIYFKKCLLICNGSNRFGILNMISNIYIKLNRLTEANNTINLMINENIDQIKYYHLDNCINMYYYCNSKDDLTKLKHKLDENKSKEYPWKNQYGALVNFINSKLSKLN